MGNDEEIDYFPDLEQLLQFHNWLYHPFPEIKQKAQGTKWYKFQLLEIW